MVETLNDSADSTQDQSVDMEQYSNQGQVNGEDCSLPESIVIDPPEEEEKTIGETTTEETTENG